MSHGQEQTSGNLISALISRVILLGVSMCLLSEPYNLFQVGINAISSQSGFALFRHIFGRSDLLRAHHNKASYSETYVAGLSCGFRGVLLFSGLTGQTKKKKNLETSDMNFILLSVLLLSFH